MRQPATPLPVVHAEVLEAALDALGEISRASTSVIEDEHPHGARLAIHARLEHEWLRCRRAVTQDVEDLCEPGAWLGTEERESDVERVDAAPDRQVLSAPLRERRCDLIRNLEGQKEPDPLIALDGIPSGHVDVCRFSNNRRTRWREVAVARPRIISRSPGSSVRTPRPPSGPAA